MTSSHKVVVYLDRATKNQVIYREDTEDAAVFLLYLHKGFVRAVGGDIIGWEVTLTPIRNDGGKDPEEQP